MNSPTRATLPLILGLAALLGCHGSDGANGDSRCHPLAVDDCLLPWPSSYYQKSDATSATGYRLALPAGVLPSNQQGVPVDVTRYNALDGYSPAGMLVANLKARLDPQQLPPSSDLTRSLDPAATVQLLRFDTGERVPLFAEVDNNALVGEDQVLLIHPQVRLEPKTRYLVALQKLVDDQGKRVSNAPFEALKSGDDHQRSACAALRPAYQEIFAKLTAAGLKQADLTLAWDFVTGSDEQLLSHLVSMRDQALAAWESMRLGYTVQLSPKTDRRSSAARARWARFRCRRSSPRDEREPRRCSSTAAVNRSCAGRRIFRWSCTSPSARRRRPRPLPFMVFGHGLFGSALERDALGLRKEPQRPAVHDRRSAPTGSACRADDVSSIAGDGAARLLALRSSRPIGCSRRRSTS